MPVSELAPAPLPARRDTLAERDLRAPPHNIEAEMALLGAILMDNRCYGHVASFLLPEHFYDDLHQLIYQTCAMMIEDGTKADPVTVKDMIAAEDLKRVGGPTYLVRLAVTTPSLVSSADYGRTIFDRWQRRQLIDIQLDMVERIHSVSWDDPATTIAEDVATRLDEVAGQTPASTTTLAAATTDALASAEVAYKLDGKMPGITCGYTELDRALGGLEPGNLYLVAGRPSMGKTAMVLWGTWETARAGHSVLFFSLEMKARQLARRLIGPLAGMSPFDLKAGTFDGPSFNRAFQAGQKLAELPFHIDESIQLAEIKARARAAKRRGLGLIVVDHIGLVQGSKDVRRGGNRTAEVEEITMALKQLAKELDVPLIALSQLNRGNEQRDDKRPQLADLRQSGSIEQDADVVMFVYRESYYLKRSMPAQKMGESASDFSVRMDAWQTAMTRAAGVAEIFLAKQRDGRAGETVKLHFEDRLARFSNLVTDHQSESTLL